MLFSIITVTYNAEAVVRRTLQSVQGQTCRDFEHLIIDGASTDATVSIAQSFGCKVFSEPDRGLYDAMNKGIARAKGDYLIFLNAGDAFHSADTLQQVATHIYNTRARGLSPADASAGPYIVYGETDLVDADGRFLRHRRLQAPDVLTWRSFTQGMLVCHQSFYVSRSIALLEAYDLQYRFSADFDWCIRCLKRAEAMVAENEKAAHEATAENKTGIATSNTRLILTDYLSEGMTTKNHKASLRERFVIMRRHYGLLRTLGVHLWFVLRAAIKK